MDRSTGIEGGGRHDRAVGGVERHEQGVASGVEIGGGRVDDVAVPAGHVAGPEVAVDGVEHHGTRTVDIVRACRPDAVVKHLHIICIKTPRP